MLINLSDLEKQQQISRIQIIRETIEMEVLGSFAHQLWSYYSKSPDAKTL